MKIYDLRGRPRPNKRQEVIREMGDEGLLDVDMDDWDLLSEYEDEDNWDDPDEDWWDNLLYSQLVADKEDDLNGNPASIISAIRAEEKETD